MHLPRLVLIADQFTQADNAQRTVVAVEEGVRWVHLRDHAASEEAFADAAKHLVARLRSIADDVRISINTRLAVADACRADLHVGTRGPSVEQARKRLHADAVIGFSAHDLDEGQQAVASGVDYLFFSPIFSTSSKSDQPGVGIKALRRFSRAVPETPVFALGGITPDRVLACRAGGAYGVAVLSGIMQADEPAEAVQRYSQRLSYE